MNREPFVMDCWFDSGCASFAQWHHPFDNPETFENNFPIDYICEGVDQTRGWFYTLLAVSTTVFDSLCYKRCLSLGLILDAEGKKMSKSRTKRRKAMHKISRPHFLIDPETGVAKQSHRVNPVDGTYNGRQVKEPNNE